MTQLSVSPETPPHLPLFFCVREISLSISAIFSKIPIAAALLGYSYTGKERKYEQKRVTTQVLALLATRLFRKTTA